MPPAAATTSAAPVGEGLVGALRPPVGPLRRRWLLELALVTTAVVVGTALRLYASSRLWSDEALSVNIARLPVDQLLDALRHDGHPPLYYVLLHGWMRIFGTSDTAVRSLSGLSSVLALPVIWYAGRRYAGRQAGMAALVLLAVSPFAIRYASEARMYSLVSLLALLGWVAVRSAVDRPTILRLASVTLLSGLLLLTHYWALYAIAATVVVLGWAAWRGRRSLRRAYVRVALALTAGGLLLVPWLPGLAFQARRTGTPWANPTRPGLILSGLVTAVPAGEAVLFGVGLVLLIALALLSRPLDGDRLELDLHIQPQTRPEAAVVALTLAMACVVGYLVGLTTQARYASIIFPIMVLLAALGVGRLTLWSLRTAVLVVLAALGLVGGLSVVVGSRTQAGEIASAIDQRYAPGDVVAYCPDTLSPAVGRVLVSRPLQLTLPDSGDVRRVDWVDYQERVDRSDPAAFARLASEQAGAGAVWLVWTGGAPGLGRSCERVVEALGQLRPGPDVPVAAASEGEERASLYRFAAPGGAVPAG